MKCKYIYFFVVLIGVTLWATSSVSQAQLVREDGAKSITGVLIWDVQETVEWTFKSGGEEIIFASLDADIYRKTMGGHETVTSAGEEGGCGDTGGECGGEEGGPGLFYIEVVGQDKTVLCRADKPLPPPGWMRDPRMACKLPATNGQKTYTLRIGLKKPKGENPQEYYAFLLNVSLRGIAPNGMNIQSAIGGNRF